MIQSFACAETAELFPYQHSRKFRAFERVALRKLLQLHASTELRLLASPPGNQLEALRPVKLAEIAILSRSSFRSLRHFAGEN
jgi:toxin HigB-1